MADGKKKKAAKRRRAAARAALLEKSLSEGSDASAISKRLILQSTPTNVSQEAALSHYFSDSNRSSDSMSSQVDVIGQTQNDSKDESVTRIKNTQQDKISSNQTEETSRKQGYENQTNRNQTYALTITFGKQYPNFTTFATGLKQLSVCHTSIAVQTGLKSFNVVVNSVSDLNKVMGAHRWDNRPSCWQFNQMDDFTIRKTEDVYTAKRQETKSFIVKNVPLYINIDDFKQELECEIPYCKVFRITSAATGNLTTLVRVVTNDLDAYTRALENGIHVMYQYFKCEEPHNKVRINQCTHCYSFQHRYHECPNATVCVKCGEKGHIAHFCSKENEHCVNCNGQHKSNAQICPMRKQIESKVLEKRQSYANIVRAPQPDLSIGKFLAPSKIKLFDGPIENLQGIRDTEHIRQLKTRERTTTTMNKEQEPSIRTVHTEALKQKAADLTIEQLVTIIAVISVEIKRRPNISISQLVGDVQAALVLFKCI